MGLFGKKKPGDDYRLERIQLRRIALEQRRHRMYMPPSNPRPVISSREYRIFKQTEKRKLIWYEKLARFSEKLLKVTPGKKTEEDLGKQIAFTGLLITPASVMSLFVLTLIAFIVIGAAFTIASLSNPIYSLVIIAMGLGLAYYFYKYPANLVKKLRVQASSEVVLATLYMVVSMRISPNLERALRFSAANISGALSWDMRKLIWDIEMRKYYSASEALTDYIAKWKPENEEFAEALRLIRDSETQIPERGRKILDEALDVILDGTKTRMKHYAQELNLPVMIIHMMGIILPVMGTIMAPLAAVFMSDMVSPVYFVLGYDIILPLMIIWFINNTLSKRPVTFSQVDTSHHPDLPPKGSFWIGKGKSFPALPLAILVMLAFIVPAGYFFIENPAVLSLGMKDANTGSCTFLGEPWGDACPALSLAMSIFLLLGIASGIAIYYFLSTFQRLTIQKDVEDIEGQFELALFQLGNRIAGGTPTEVAMERSIGDMKDIEISNLFKIALRNIKTLGMTFDEALFNRKYGALRYYPSKLIRNIMYAVVDTSKKGVTYASEAMLRISRYLKNIRETQEYIREMLSETTSSMKFQAYFLTPLITGLIVSMADVMIQVLVKLSCYLNSISMSETGGIGGMNISGLFANMETVISPSLFQLIVGIYVMEVIIILAVFTTKIGHGENKILQWNTVAKMLIIGMFIYFLVAMASSTMFGDLIGKALEGMIADVKCG